jgi:hypothetical protein
VRIRGGKEREGRFSSRVSCGGGFREGGVVVGRRGGDSGTKHCLTEWFSVQG